MAPRKPVKVKASKRRHRGRLITVKAYCRRRPQAGWKRREEHSRGMPF